MFIPYTYAFYFSANTFIEGTVPPTLISTPQLIKFSDSPPPPPPPRIPTKVEKLRFARVFFGASCSQVLLNGVLQIHVDKYCDIHPEIVDRLSRHLYVDDLNSGTDTVTDGIEIYHKIKSIFKEGNFNV